MTTFELLIPPEVLSNGCRRILRFQKHNHGEWLYSHGMQRISFELALFKSGKIRKRGIPFSYPKSIPRWGYELFDAEETGIFYEEYFNNGQVKLIKRHPNSKSAINGKPIYERYNSKGITEVLRYSIHSEKVIRGEPHYKKFYNTGELKKELRNEKNPNPEILPNETRYYKNGVKKYERYGYKFFTRHRTTGPSEIWRSEDGTITKQNFHFENVKVDENMCTVSLKEFKDLKLYTMALNDKINLESGSLNMNGDESEDHIVHKFKSAKEELQFLRNIVLKLHDRFNELFEERSRCTCSASLKTQENEYDPDAEALDSGNDDDDDDIKLI